ncbi:high mobility group protein dsp1 [Anaeramoeba flamelloides]|uniref:High mobility group protein dsp1 n=1 Tax=Anaeramoeba flamelloides TaxID=1746091 RepID=A0AAV8A4U8_9EUKA|nr:high mobility group protein dsp1 [Anaeramoeba flamelloides]|eukprot:Anaeramoba_flamelloidesa89671_38.p1 GENE.a89671_38~~a89671_38.p1  ORF type:complete len:286 (+),score=36.68 a89671_38:44-901(+)
MSERKSQSEIEKDRPKGRLTSFMIFNKEVNPKVRKEFPDMNFTEASRECSKRWRNLSEKDKQFYIDKSEQDKIRYETAMKEFLRLHPGAERKKPTRKSSRTKVGKSRRLKRDPKKPKGTRTSYQFYSIDAWKEVKEDFPKYDTGAVSKELGRRWRNLPEKEKEYYVKKSDHDKIRYEKEMKRYNRKIKNKSNTSEGKHKKDKRRDSRRKKKDRRRSRDRSRSRRDSKRHRRRNSRKHRRRRYSSSSSGYSSFTESSTSGYSSSNSGSYTSNTSSSASYPSDSFSD